jgi:type III restriction enzyme
VAQIENVDKVTEYEDLHGVIKSKNTIVHKETYTIDEVVNKIVDTFKTRDFEAKIRFPKGTYKKENLPPEKEIREYVLESMRKVGIKSGVLTEDNANRIFKAFQTLFRTRGSTIVLSREVEVPKRLSTKNFEKESMAVGAIKHGSTVFYTDEYKNECSKEQIDILNDIISDISLPRSASKEVNHYCLKSPVSIVLTKQDPERRFVEAITNPKVAESIDSWIKSKDQNFYSIEYAWRKGEHPTQGHFNPDFFIKCGDNIVVVEIKADGDDSDENKAKLKWAREHFDILNQELKKNKINQKYYFHFLSPSSYFEFTEYLID